MYVKSARGKKRKINVKSIFTFREIEWMVCCELHSLLYYICSSFSTIIFIIIYLLLWSNALQIVYKFMFGMMNVFFKSLESLIWHKYVYYDKNQLIFDVIRSIKDFDVFQLRSNAARRLQCYINKCNDYKKEKYDFHVVETWDVWPT